MDILKRMKKEMYDYHLARATTEHEYMMCESICRKEIMGKAEEIKKTRKLTPAEMAILNSL